HEQANTHMSRFRVTPVVNVLLGDSIPRPDRGEQKREKWCRAMLILFKPWRTIADLKQPEQSWTQAFDTVDFSPYSCRIMKNMHVENECKDARDKYEELRK
ncbi:hypothetical protein C8R43DRAFT_816481, partial [Mycena crocata]